MMNSSAIYGNIIKQLWPRTNLKVPAKYCLIRYNVIQTSELTFYLQKITLVYEVIEGHDSLFLSSLSSEADTLHSRISTITVNVVENK